MGNSSRDKQRPIIKIFWKICNMITYFFMSLAILWVCYIITMALWNTFCRGCPNAWYQENIHPYIPRPIPPVVEEIEEDYDDWDDY